MLNNLFDLVKILSSILNNMFESVIKNNLER